MRMFQGLKMFKSHAALAVMLVAALLLTVMPSSSEAAAATIKPVYITSNSYVKLDNADIIPSNNGRIASFTVTFYNGGSSAINLADYWVRLASTSGTKYTANLIEGDKTKKTVPAKSSTTLTYYSQVPASISLTNLVLKVIKFDFSVAGYEKTLGSFTFPAGYTNDVKVNGYKAAKLNGAVVNMRVNKATISKGTENNVVNVDLVLRNTENFETTLSNFGFYIQASNGAMYQMKLTSDQSQGILLRSKILETVKLTITIPSAISTTGMKLITTQSIGEGASALNLPVAKFMLSLAASSTSANSYAYVNGDYSYNVKVSSIQKYAWLNEENIIGQLTITNNGSKTAPVPQITGAFYLGDKAEITTKAMSMGAQVSIPAKSSIDVYYYGKVPTSTSLTDLKLKLFEKSGETQRELAALNTTATKTPQSITFGSANNIDDFGVKLSTAVTEVRLFEGSSYNLYAVYMDVTNNQNSAVSTSKLAGYLETTAGSQYNASIIKTDSLIGPSKKEQIIITTEVPKDIELSGANLVLGLAYNDEGIVKANDAAATGYINASRYLLPEATQTTSDFSSIKIGAYNVNIDNLITHLNDTTIDIDLNGTVTRDNSYDAFSSKKFTFVIEDESINLVMFTTPIEIDAATGQYVWKTGSNYTNLVQDMSNKLISKTFKVNIYEEINGFKTKLVSKDIKWSPYLNWANPSVK